VLPNLLITGIKNAIEKADAYKVYVSNVMTQPGETDNMSAYDHVDVLLKHTGESLIDACLINSGDVPKHVMKKYQEKDQFPVALDIDRISEKGVAVFEENVISAEEAIRHNPQLLAQALLHIQLLAIRGFQQFF